MSNAFCYLCLSMSEKRTSFFERLKQKWNIQSNSQLIVILLVFSITGSLAVFVAKPLLELVGANSETMPLWLYIPIRIAIIFPAYQVLILIVGSIFGQFKFFWNFEKKMLSRLGFKRFFSK